MKKTIIAIIPARAGSKGIPGKNIKELAGKPMIGYIIETVRSLSLLDRVMVSTEDEGIAAVARQYGAEVPFLRPKELAEDHVATLPVLQHAVEYLEREERYIPDYVLLVYPTSPLLSPRRIEEAVNMALSRDSDSVVSGFFDYGQYWTKVEGGYERLYPKVLTNRQEMTPLFKLNGAIFLTKTSILKKQVVADKIDVLPMEQGENVDVDEPADFEAVRKILEAQKSSL
ncbi:MAG: acylneuraminate cytidylyltransferase family protein [Candidatus Magasanikbacteria bacterium]|nr:acylneuraminate cytidylyltransferase family protein [Candidatus Magasanikbacteria bacterium]